MAPPIQSPARDETARKIRELQQRQKDLEKRLDNQSKAQDRLRKKQQAMSRLTVMQTDVAAKCAGLRKAATRIGIAYRLAARRHRKAIEDDEKEKALEKALANQLIFGALTMLSSGALSWVFEKSLLGNAAARATRAEELQKIDRVYIGSGNGPAAYKSAMQAIAQKVKDGLPPPDRRPSDLFLKVTKDMLGRALGSASGIVQSVQPPPPPSEPASQDPEDFKDKLVLQIDNVEGPALMALKSMAERIDGLSDDAWDGYDDRRFGAEYQTWQSQAALLADDADLPADDDMANELERFIWALWIPRLHYTKTVQAKTWLKTEYVPEHEADVYERVRKHVDDRFVALGIETEHETDLHPEQEDKILIQWGEKYLRNVQPWVAKAAAPPVLQWIGRFVTSL